MCARPPSGGCSPAVTAERPGAVLLGAYMGFGFKAWGLSLRFVRNKGLLYYLPMVLEIPGLFGSPYYIDINYP